VTFRLFEYIESENSGRELKACMFILYVLFGFKGRVALTNSLSILAPTLTSLRNNYAKIVN
jgi:hypothetical protein